MTGINTVLFYKSFMPYILLSKVKEKVDQQYMFGVRNTLRKSVETKHAEEIYKQ